MRNWTLDIVIKHFDAFLKDVDFKHLPERESEEYRQLILQTANNVMFSEGRYSQITEWTLEMFDEAEVCALVRNLNEINQLKPEERVRLQFYLDVKEVCYPLFRGKKIDWSAWPWLLNNGTSSLENKELFDLITNNERLNLSAAIVYDMMERVWNEEDLLYSSVAKNEASNAYEYSLNNIWGDEPDKPESQKKLAAAITECADKLWKIENHCLVGRLLGFSHLEQSIYDSFDTFICDTYLHNQVLCTRELAAWIHENWTMGECNPSDELIKALYEEWQEVMKKYDVHSPDNKYSFSILLYDVLGVSMFPEKNDDEWEDDEWEDDEFDDEFEDEFEDE